MDNRKRTKCREYQLMMTEYVLKDLSHLSNELYKEIGSHLRIDRCAECIEHYDFECRLQRSAKRRQIPKN